MVDVIVGAGRHAQGGRPIGVCGLGFVGLALLDVLCRACRSLMVSGNNCVIPILNGSLADCTCLILSVADFKQ